MVLGQIGEDAHREADPLHPLEGQRVAGDLHDHMGTPGVRHAAKEALELEGFRSGALGGDDLGADHVLVGADEAHLGPQGLLQDVLEEVGGGGLAVGAGDAHQLHGSRRVSEPVDAHMGESRPAVRGAHEGNVPLRRFLAEDAGRALLQGAHDGCGACGDGHGDEAVSVGLAAGHGHEEVAGLRLPGVVADAGDLQRRVPAPV